MEDAYVLAQELRSATSVETALDMHACRRTSRVKWVQEQSRAVGERLRLLSRAAMPPCATGGTSCFTIASVPWLHRHSGSVPLLGHASGARAAAGHGPRAPGRLALPGAPDQGDLPAAPCVRRTCNTRRSSDACFALASSAAVPTSTVGCASTAVRRELPDHVRGVRRHPRGSLAISYVGRGATFAARSQERWECPAGGPSCCRPSPPHASAARTHRQFRAAPLRRQRLAPLVYV